jgi:hypothetical protein
MTSQRPLIFLSLLILFSYLLSSVSSSPPTPSLPNKFSFEWYWQKEDSTQFNVTVAVSHPEFFRLSTSSEILLTSYKENIGYFIPAVSFPEPLFCIAVPLNGSAAVIVPLFDFSEAIYNGTYFVEGTAADQWLNIAYTAETGHTIEAEGFIDTFTGIPIFINVPGPDNDALKVKRAFNFDFTPPSPRLFTLSPTVASACEIENNKYSNGVGLLERMKLHSFSWMFK